MNDFRTKSTIHEIKNQISVCDLYLEVIRRTLEKQGIKDETLQRAIHNIKNSLELITNSTKDLRDLQLAEINLAEIINSTFEICHTYGNTELKNNVPQNHTIVADKVKFTSALTNIIKNAIEAGATEITISTENNVISIQNNGAPIPATLQEKIFTDGFTTKENGSGLGLMLTREALKAQGYDLKLEKSDKNGTVFSIEK